MICGLAKTDAGIDADAIVRNPCGLEHAGLTHKIGGHLGDHIVVAGLRLHGLGLAQHVHHNEARLAAGRHVHHIGVTEA